MSRAVAWNLGLGIAGAAVVAGYALWQDVTWNVPLVVLLLMMAFLPAAKEVGRGRASRSGARLRRQHEARQQDDL